MEINLTNTVKTGYSKRFNFSNSNHMMYTILLCSFQMQCGFLIISLKSCVLPAGIYLLKVNNRNTRTRCEICSKLTIKTPERRLASFWCLYC